MSLCQKTAPFERPKESSMPNPRLRVVVTRRLPEAVETRMTELFDVELRDPDTAMTREELAAAMQRADVLVPTITDTIDATLLAQAGARLKLIANYGAGVDNIDVHSARQRGVLVSNTPGVLTEDTADMVLALLLSVTRHIPQGLAEMQAGAWSGWSPMAHLGSRLGGKRLGILGMGRIGQAVARRAAAFGMQIHYHNRRRLRPEVEESLQATWWESLDQMLARMDVLSINCPHTPSTFHLVNARRLKLMKPTAVLVNTSRGEVLDENALTRALRAGELAGAGLDVFEHGHEVNPRLRELPNVVLLPHMGSATLEGRIEMGEKVILNIKTFADGHRPPDQVLPSML
jgi:glyoxylate reductase